MAVSNFNAERSMRRSQERFANFTKDFVRASKKSEDTAMRQIFLQLLKLIILKTPVDTARAKSGWHVAFEAAGGKAPGRESSQGKAEGSFKHRQAFYSAINSVNYIQALEFGHSKQAPVGMVRVSMLQMRVGGGRNLRKPILDHYRRAFNTSSKRMPPLRAAR